MRAGAVRCGRLIYHPLSGFGTFSPGHGRGRRSNPKFMSVGQTSRGRRRFALDCIDGTGEGPGRQVEGEKEKWGTSSLSLRGNPRKFGLSFLIGIRTPPGLEGRNRQVQVEMVQLQTPLLFVLTVMRALFYGLA